MKDAALMPDDLVLVTVGMAGYISHAGCYGNASTRKRLNAKMPQKPFLRNFRFILGNPSKLENVEGLMNIFEAFPFFLRRFLFLKKLFKLYFVEAFPLFIEVFPFFIKFLNFIC